MSKVILLGALLVMSTIAHNVFAGNIYPTNGLSQEMAGTIGSGKISIDLINTSDFREHVRFGLSTGGEAMFATNIGGTGDMIGYKHLVNRSVAAYGLLSFNSGEDTDMLFGISYSGSKNGFMYNVNAEIFLPGDGGEKTTEIKAGVYYSTQNRYTGRVHLIGEYIIDSTNDTSSIYAALRFKPNKNVRIDVGVYESVDDGGNSDSSVGIPLFFRLNLSM